jgi:hypothetical protein
VNCFTFQLSLVRIEDSALAGMDIDDDAVSAPLHGGQIVHARHAQIARRAIVPQSIYSVFRNLA